ncbi:putative major pilin subunit [Prochlorococcus marinus str. MIT 1313]|uniref:prepilin-type N-terminal cleavage/methylation domain-containing protein n=1 Tax=Prochlorococcus TaxID=1218 RepID=UPI0007B3CCD4|nr:prepilin-type N-terminal cleavage/methylation domain-containing protein [Prochlorococcus marinus]KZR68746.1 putative major pilin subunit [Prochlorococcus marinus str. MIT 1313]
MTAFKAYLASPKIKRVLKRRPGEEGFSLIELVVVVAVLAVLAAIAIPNFTALTDDARVNTAGQTLVNQYKECEYTAARTGTGDHTQVASGKDSVIAGVEFLKDAIETKATGEACDNVAEAVVTVGSDTCTISLNYGTGIKSYAGSGSGSSASAWPKTFADCI